MAENENDLRAQLIEALSRHDWEYKYSDDYRVWSEGQKQREHIRDLMKRVPDGEALYDQYANMK